MSKSDMQILHALSEKGNVSPPIVGSCGANNLLRMQITKRGGELTFGIDSYWAQQIDTGEAYVVLYVADKKEFEKARTE